MSKRARQLRITLKVEYIPLPAERLEAWRAGIYLLLQYLIEEKIRLEALNEYTGIDCNGDDGGSIIALLPLANVVEG